jgi:hypothetical protein
LYILHASTKIYHVDHERNKAGRARWERKEGRAVVGAYKT